MVLHSPAHLEGEPLECTELGQQDLPPIRPPHPGPLCFPHGKHPLIINSVPLQVLLSTGAICGLLRNTEKPYFARETFLK